MSYRYQINPVGRPCHTKLDYGPWQIKLETLLDYLTDSAGASAHSIG